MASKLLVRSVIVLLMLMGLGTASPAGAARPQSGERSILFIQDSRNPIQVNFTDDDLAKVSRNAQYILEKMRINGVTCCGQRKRITQYMWVCCNGNRIRTSNPTLVWALEQVWGV